MVRTFHTLPPVLVTTFERRGEIEIVHAQERKDRVYISTYSGHRVVIPHVIDLGECVLTDVNRHDLADSMTRSLQKERSLPKINNFAKVEEYQRQPIRKRLTAEEKAE